MRRVRLVWKNKDADMILKYINSGWISGFNKNHESWATVRNEAQMKELEKLQAEGNIWIREIKENQ